MSPNRIQGLSSLLLVIFTWLQTLPLQAMEPVAPLTTPAWTTSRPVIPEAKSAAVIRSCAAVEREEAARYRPAPSPSMSFGAASGSLYAPAKSAPPPQAQAEAKAKDQASFQDAEKSLDVHQAGKKVDSDIRRASTLYLSNDDSMSLASAQRVIYAIQNFLPLYRNEIRPHELLNYFHFKTDPLVTGATFSVKAQAAPRENGETLALAVQGKTLDLAQRRAAVLTFVVDKSGSMAAQGKMEYLKEGLALLKAQLKTGDVINVVEFDHETCNAVEGFTVGRDDWRGYDRTVSELVPRGSTDLHEGLVEGYKLAERFHDPSKINRVILITDAIANTGELSPDLMASIGKYYDTRRIALSGIGVGLDFNDELLDTLTERGKGAYLFLGMREVLPRVFGSDFINLLETVARDVRFQTTFPKGLQLEVFYGEEVSTDKEKVQPIHYFANTSQLFLLDLKGSANQEDPLRLQIEYQDPVTGQSKTEAFAASMASIQQSGQENVAKARLLMSLAQLLEKTALPGSRPNNNWSSRATPDSLRSTEGKKLCQTTQAEMQKQAAIYSDAETTFAIDLAGKYCSRF